MGVENFRPKEIIKPNWLHLDTNNGAPFTMSIWQPSSGIVNCMQQKEIMLPFSRFQHGRRTSPYYKNVGPGIDGHLIGLDVDKVKDILLKIQNEVYGIMRSDVGFTALNSFIEDPSKSIHINLLKSGRIAFQIALARVRAIRESIEQGGYIYADSGLKIVSPDDRARNIRYRNYIYSAPPILAWELDTLSKGDYTFKQTIDSVNTSSIPPQYFGVDIGTDKQLNLVAELGRFAFPPAREILASYR
jgi:hypothetical protein